MVDYKIEPPYEALDKDRPWYTAKVGVTTWNILKAKLTGGTEPGGTSYASTVNLSDEDADKLIENMKKDPRGYPQFDDGGGGMKFYENYEKYQAWLVEQYLGKPVEQEEEEELEEDIPEGLDDLLGSIQEDDEEIPAGLDDLLGSIQEPKVTTIKSSAIVPTKFLGERYEKYRDELIAEGTIEGEQLTGEERKEGFKTRNDPNKFGTFIENFLNRKKKSDEVETAGGGAVIVTKQLIDPDKIVPLEEDDDGLDSVTKKLDELLATVKEGFKLEEDKAESDRKAEEKKKRKKTEKELETSKESFLGKAAKQIIKPVKSLLDKIFGFLKTLLLGKALMSLIDWIANPENRGKIDTIFRFFKDWWPTLLGAYILFGTSFGKFVRSIIGLTARFTKKILTKALPSLLKAAKANPIAAAGLAVVGTAAVGGIAQSMTPSNDPEAEEGQSQLDDTQDFGGITGAPISGDMLGFQGGGEVKGKPGIDQNPAMLTDGEFVMSKGAVQKYGLDTLEAMNAAGGGTNMPKIMNKITYAAGGGLIGERKGDKYEKPLPEPVALAMDGGGESFNIFNPMSWFRGDAQKATKGELQDVSNDTLAGKLYNRRKKQEEAMKMLRGYDGGGEVKGGSSFNIFNPMSWFSGDAQKATDGKLDNVSNNTLAGKLYNRRKQQEEAMKMLRGYDGGGEVEQTPIEKMEFNPSNYFQGDNVYSSKRIVNPGQTGKSFFVRYAQNDDGSIEVRQVNKVVKDGNIFNGFTPDLTGVKPGSEEFQKVVGSANTKNIIENELKDRAKFTTRSSSVSKEMKPERDKVNAWIKGGRNLTVSPHAMVGYDYNQSYQTTKQVFADRGVEGKKGEELSASAAAQLAMPTLEDDKTVLPTSDESRISTDTVNQYTVAKTPQKQDNKPESALDIIKNYLMAGLSMSGEKKKDKKEDNSLGEIITGETQEKETRLTSPSAGYGSQGSKIAGNLGKYIEQNLVSAAKASDGYGDYNKITEHPDFGGVVGRHATGSYHDDGRALDIGAYTNEQGKIVKVINEFNRKNSVRPAELITGRQFQGTTMVDPGGHSDHVHVAYSSGGEVKGKPGIDKNPAMLSKGEIVMNNEAVQGVGKQNLLAANKYYGGQDANKPKIVKGTMHAASGGYVPGPAPAMVGDKSVKSTPITPLNRSKPKVTFVDLGSDTETIGPTGGAESSIPAFSAASRSRTKLNTLGINL